MPSEVWAAIGTSMSTSHAQTQWATSQSQSHCFVSKLTNLSIKDFAGNNTLSDPTTEAWVENKMATGHNTSTAKTIAWNNAFVPLTLIIPTFTLPTARTVESVTVSGLSAPTQLGPTRAAEASVNLSSSARIRGLGLCYLLLITAMVICQSL